MKTIARDSRHTVAILLGMVLLCIPAFFNRSPLLFADSRSYYVGGRMVVDRAIAVLNHFGQHAEPLAPVVTHAKAVRSIYYSLISYLLISNGTLWAIAAVQAALSVWLIVVTSRIFRPASPVLLLLALMTVCSTLPWTVSTFMPDIFTPLMVLTLACLLLAWADITHLLRISLMIMLCTCIVMHITNLPIAVGLTIVVIAIQWRSLGVCPARWGAVCGSIAIAVLAMLVVNFVGFGKWSMAPQSPPFLLARSIEDGPGKLYLQEHCPQIKLVMCRHLDRLDLNVDDFTWADNGVFATVSPEEQDAIRKENGRVAVAAALEHPWMQLHATVRNIITQLTFFDLRDSRFPNSASITRTDLISDIHQTFPGWLIVWSVLHYAVVLASLYAIVWVWGKMTWRDKQLTILVLAAVLLNSVSGATSSTSARYGARMIWLVPFLAFLLVPYSYDGRWWARTQR